jgi:hypothetical protein
MRFESFERRFIGDVVRALLIVLFVTLVRVHGVAGAEVTGEDLTAYFDSLEDAKVATQGELARNLIAIVPREDEVNIRKLKGGRLIWEELPGKSRILVTTFMDGNTYDTFYRANMGKSRYALTKSLWVTVVPELQNRFIGQESCPPSRERVVKVLGLNPAKSQPYEVLVEMWVSPRDLFRPSADPEITDHEAELPTLVDGTWMFPADLNSFSMLNDKVLYKEKAWQTTPPIPFRDWYVRNAKPEAYEMQDFNSPDEWPMPWTRMGYTYDWGNHDNHVGLSEFIVRIHPNQKSPDGQTGVVRVGLVRAIDSRDPAAWNQYFQCEPIADEPQKIGDSVTLPFQWSPEDPQWLP